MNHNTDIINALTVLSKEFPGKKGNVIIHPVQMLDANQKVILTL